MSSLFLSLCAVEIACGLCVLALLVRAREFRTYWPLLILSMWQVVPFSALLYLRNFQRGHMSPPHAYKIYYFTYWISFVLAAACAIGLTYTILHGALRPLKGLRNLARIVYFWAAAISIFVAIDNSTTATISGYNTLQDIAVHFERATGIVTVSLIVFVCLAIRPMGLSVRSRIFGTGIGLGIISVMTTLEANFLMRPQSLYNKYALTQITVNCIAEVIWIYYFAVPEPKRKFILLATTSPFHQWNAVAEKFGQEPGFVAIGGIPPDAFTPAEMEVFRRASAKMTEMKNEPTQNRFPSGAPEKIDRSAFTQNDESD